MITGYIGDKGSGKTLSMTIKLYHDYELKNRMIYSNMGFKFKNFRYINKEFYDDFKAADFQINDCAFVVDEAHVFIDSRRSMSSRNIIFSKFITQSRKRGVDMFYTTQDVSYERFMTSGQVELRLRKLTDEVILCKTITFLNGKTPVENYEELIDPKKDKMYCINFKYRGGMLISKSCVLANPYFKLYDTNQIIDLDF